MNVHERWEKASSFYFLRYEKNEMCLTAQLAFQLAGNVLVYGLLRDKAPNLANTNRIENP